MIWPDLQLVASPLFCTQSSVAHIHVSGIRTPVPPLSLSPSLPPLSFSLPCSLRSVHLRPPTQFLTPLVVARDVPPRRPAGVLCRCCLCPPTGPQRGKFDCAALWAALSALSSGGGTRGVADARASSSNFAQRPSYRDTGGWMGRRVCSRRRQAAAHLCWRAWRTQWYSIWDAHTNQDNSKTSYGAGSDAC